MLAENQSETSKAIRYTMAAVAEWVESRDGKKNVRFHLTKANMYRLLTLRAWSLRYRLSITDILDMIVRVLRGQTKVTGKMVLGVSVATLTGQAAQRIIEEKIKRRYPNDEHITIWRDRERRRQLRRERTEEGDVVSFPRGWGYRQRMLEERYALEEEAAKKWRKRKRYRGNPWI